MTEEAPKPAEQPKVIEAPKRQGCRFCGKVRSLPEAIRERLREVQARRRGG